MAAEAPTTHSSRTARTLARPRRHLVFGGIAALVVALDQLTKAIVRATLDRGESWPADWAVQITHVTNSGAAFGLFQGQALFLAFTTIFGLAAVLIYYFAPPLEHRLIGPALGLVLGGALGNLVDRVRLGRVTDFIDFPHYPNFNVADSAITVGVATLLILLVVYGNPEAGETEADDGGPRG